MDVEDPVEVDDNEPRDALRRASSASSKLRRRSSLVRADQVRVAWTSALSRSRSTISMFACSLEDVEGLEWRDVQRETNWARKQVPRRKSYPKSASCMREKEFNKLSSRRAPQFGITAGGVYERG